MQNPYEQLGSKAPLKVEYDEWGGAFSCQTQGCYNVESIARYLKAERILTWKCKDGHISRIEDIDE